jgi:acyl dehydratase
MRQWLSSPECFTLLMFDFTGGWWDHVSLVNGANSMTDESQQILTDEIVSYIGREGPIHNGVVSEVEMERYATAVSMAEPHPLYVDAHAANSSPFKGKIAPFHFYSVPFSRMAHHSALGEDGLARPKKAQGNSESTSLSPPIPLPRTMAGGTEVEYTRPIRIGEQLTSQTHIADIVEKQGRQGPLVFTTTETVYRDRDGETVVVVRSKRISR